MAMLQRFPDESDESWNRRCRELADAVKKWPVSLIDSGKGPIICYGATLETFTWDPHAAD
jgi:hypothetical protein